MKLVRISLIVLQLLIMFNAFGGGIYGFFGAPGVDPAWLDGSPFSSYFIPSLFLFIVIGGGLALATGAWVRRSRLAPRLSLLMGVLLMGWIAAQLAMIGSVSWLQPAIFVAGVAITALAGVALRAGQRRVRAGATA